jgi:hypothetical protein
MRRRVLLSVLVVVAGSASVPMILERTKGRETADAAADAETKTNPDFHSIRDRLAYEKSVDRNQTPTLSPEAAERLLRADQMQGFAVARNHKVSLAMLHDQNIEKFAKSQNFGMSRMVRPGESSMPFYFHDDAPPPNPIPLASVPSLSDAEAAIAPVELGSRLSSDEDLVRLWRLPTLTEVRGVHDQAVGSFANPFTIGFVADVDHVAKFKPHAVVKAPTPPAALGPAATTAKASSGPVERHSWKVVRMELVSLIKFETPRVYVSKNMPRMEDLANVETRPLSTFEVAALEKLVDGDDFGVEAGPNRIEMLGSLRVSNFCLQCHDVPRGTLFGAFSYELRRDPPIRVDALEQAGAQ